MAFRDYCSELTGTIPRLPYPLAQKLINRAWDDITKLRLWSWRIGEADIITTSIISAGTVTATLGSTTLTCDADASAALNAVYSATPPLASSTLGTGRQIRLSTMGRPIYTITAVNRDTPTALVLTLDRAYTGPSGSGQSYQCYKCYFAPPTDSLRYLSLTNARAGYSITGKRLYYDQSKLNQIDPQRGGNGEAYIIASYRVDSTGRPVHEWYPHPTNGSTYHAIYVRRTFALTEAQDIPVTFPESCLIHRGLMLAADWAMANVATYEELAGTNWVLFKQGKLGDFKDTLVQAIKEDDEIFPLKSFLQGGSVDLPLGGEFLQGHDVSSLIGGI